METRLQNPQHSVDGRAAGAPTPAVRRAFSHRFVRDIEEIKSLRRLAKEIQDKKGNQADEIQKLHASETIGWLLTDCKKLEDKLSAELKWAEERVKQLTAMIHDSATDLETVSEMNELRSLYEYKVKEIKKVL